MEVEVATEEVAMAEAVMVEVKTTPSISHFVYFDLSKPNIEKRIRYNQEKAKVAKEKEVYAPTLSQFHLENLRAFLAIILFTKNRQQRWLWWRKQLRWNGRWILIALRFCHIESDGNVFHKIGIFIT